MHFKPKPGYVELDGKKLYAAVFLVRQVGNLQWSEVEDAAGVSLASLKRLKKGRSIEATTFLRLVKWLGQTRVTAFARTIQKGDYENGD